MKTNIRTRVRAEYPNGLLRVLWVEDAKIGDRVRALSAKPRESVPQGDGVPSADLWCDKDVATVVEILSTVED